MWITRMQKNCNWKKMDFILRGYFVKKSDIRLSPWKRIATTNDQHFK